MVVFFPLLFFTLSAKAGLPLPRLELTVKYLFIPAILLFAGVSFAFFKHNMRAPGWACAACALGAILVYRGLAVQETRAKAWSQLVATELSLTPVTDTKKLAADVVRLHQSLWPDFATPRATISGAHGASGTTHFHLRLTSPLAGSNNNWQHHDDWAILLNSPGGELAPGALRLVQPNEFGFRTAPPELAGLELTPATVTVLSAESVAAIQELHRLLPQRWSLHWGGELLLLVFENITGGPGLTNDGPAAMETYRLVLQLMGKMAATLPRSSR
jgi:hypothetical protein